ncbi:MAG TPA: DUF2254 domain-containing protein [Egibacteraceae bacterium]|nr:DUF2254 domain-containing protein [Egibacteraceae bacterium]
MSSSKAIGGMLRRSLFVRPAVFVAAGIGLSVVTLALDAELVGALVPSFLHFSAEASRALLGTLAGAMLTLAGITFWVRASSVQLAAGQYSTRVVHGFLEDWFQQSIMGLLLGIFAYIVGVFRVLPEGGLVDPPQLSVNVAIALAGGSVLVILHAIRNAVQSMQVDQLARRITDETVERIHRLHPIAESPAERPPPSAPPPPLGRGTVIRATSSGWVQRLDGEQMLAALPARVTVRLEVRVGLFVIRGRPLCTVWGADLDQATVARVRSHIRLGRTPTPGLDIDSGIQQLVDLAVGSLSQGLSDVTSVHEVLAHVEMVFAELSWRRLPPKSYTDGCERLVLRPREFEWNDYVRAAFDRLRRAGSSFPDVTVATLNLLGSLARELEAVGRSERSAALWRQMRMAVEAAEAQNLFAEDLEWVRSVAVRQQPTGYADADAQAGSSASPSDPLSPRSAADRPRVTT